MPEGLLDKVIRWLAFDDKIRENAKRPIRNAQMVQYTHPDKDILPRATNTPTSLTKFGGQITRSAGKYRPTAIDVSKTKSIRDLLLDRIQLPYRIDDYKERRNIKGSQIPNYDSFELEGALGLGNGTLSIGKDDKGHYLSAFDSWDFDNSASLDRLSMALLNRPGVGKPFNQYDRFYFNPTPENKIPERFVPGTGDVNLPINHKLRP